MKYYCMWHPVQKWGSPVPVLIRHKRQAAAASGVSLKKMRELGWRWLEVVIDEPDGVEPEFMCCPTCDMVDLCKTEGHCDKSWNGYR